VVQRIVVQRIVVQRIVVQCIVVQRIVVQCIVVQRYSRFTIAPTACDTG
jgi:hypothetical protein